MSPGNPTWTPAALARETLRRQFPTVRGQGTALLTGLFTRIGPVQSQVPRSPFLSAAARHPGAGYAVVAELLESHRLLKATTLRGTVHVSTAEQHAWSAAVSTDQRAGEIARMLGVDRPRVRGLTDAIEDFCADTWRTRDEVIAHAVERLGLDAASVPAIANRLWGHSTLLRRPSDGAWDRRTDLLRRTVVPRPGVEPDAARRELVRVHLGAYGPATRRDVAWWLGDGLAAVDRAVDALGDEVTRSPGLDRDPWLDLAVPPAGGHREPGVRLLPEFDGLLLGYHPAHRDRFLAPEHLPYVWAKANGLFSPLVLARGRIVATWRTTSAQRTTGIEVRGLPGVATPTESDLHDAVAAVVEALALRLTDVVVLQPHGQDAAPGR